MDCDLERRRNRAGRITAQLVLLPDADVSAPENDSDSDTEFTHNEHDSDGDYTSSEDDLPLSTFMTQKETEQQDSDEEPLSCLAHKGTVTCNSSHVFRWRKMAALKQMLMKWKGKFSNPPSEDMTPKEYFHQFFPKTLIDHVVQQTNIYAVQQGSNFSTEASEIERYLGVLIVMGLVHMPRYELYWSKELRFPPVADVLSRQRFSDINKFIHFNDNSKQILQRTDSNYDRYFKIRPLLDALRASCLSVEPEEKMSVDEQMIPYKGKNSLRQYLPKKPKKWGFKVMARCGVSGITYDFCLYAGIGPTVEESCGYQPGDFVIKLCETLPSQMNFKVYFDNWFNFLELQLQLKKRQIWTVGTLRSNRMRGCVLKSEKELRRDGRGSSDWFVDANSGLAIVRWMDSSAVQLSSTHISLEPLSTTKRWDRKCKKYIEVPCPAIVKEYNQHMGGVDLFDMLMSLYKVDHKSNKWYRRVFFWALNLAVVNGWLLYRRHCSQKNIPKRNQYDLVKFTASISEALIHEQKLPPELVRKRGRPLSSTSAVNTSSAEQIDITERPKKRLVSTVISGKESRYDNVGHFPVRAEPKQRCKLCHNYIRMKCVKCNCHLCITKDKNCFLNYHTC